MSKRKRTKIEQKEDALRMVEKGLVKKIEVIRGARLDYKRATEVLDWLIMNGLVSSQNGLYAITDEGREILNDRARFIDLFYRHRYR